MILSNSNSGQQAAQTLEAPGKAFRLTLLRHGQTNHNRLRLVQGQMDTQLNDFGREQASLLARYLKRTGVHYDQIFTSDLSRAYETSKLLCVINGGAGVGVCVGGGGGASNIIKKDSLLRERSYGKLQGLPMSTIRQIAAAAPKSVQQAAPAAAIAAAPAANGNTTAAWAPYSKIYLPEGGETLDQVRARVEAFCDQVLFPQAGHHQHILVVSHGGTIREFMKVFKYKYGAQIRFQDLVMSPNTGVNEFDLWLGERLQVERIRANHLHALPHLTFDVFNRDNPHVNLNNLHLKCAMDLNESDKQDLKKLDQLDRLASAQTKGGVRVGVGVRVGGADDDDGERDSLDESLDDQQSASLAPAALGANSTTPTTTTTTTTTTKSVIIAAQAAPTSHLVAGPRPRDSMNLRHRQQQQVGGGCSHMVG